MKKTKKIKRETLKNPDIIEGIKFLDLEHDLLYAKLNEIIDVLNEREK